MDSPPPVTHLLLCATHRTGSNLLEEYLKAARVAGRPKEFYSPSLSKELAKQQGLPDPETDFLAYHQAIINRWRTSNGVFATKVMWRHLAVVHQRVLDSPGGAAVAGPTPWATMLALHPNPKVVWVTRRDKVKQAISMVRAKQTGVYSSVHVDYGRKQAVAPGEYDFFALRYHVEKLTAEDAGWEALFQEQGVPFEKIVFEELIKAPQEQTVALLQALGLPKPVEWHWPEVHIRPQSDPVSGQWLTRYLEDDKIADHKLDEHRERRHRARKALEKQTGRIARWARWEKSSLGRFFCQMERLLLPSAPMVRPEDARGDGVARPPE